ncbi:DMT family transporter [Aquimarina hainanensis]|uniref:DMT family transporter n=1 Tax=Aquimarina hainanensis TaxID=1578017 RepID=A0ABW5N1L1_9FLAO|nr:DMT family transporter [Aquimarina sp. TRL1]QKX04482.1 DMT family transporter [Aquimarina sp. TRL1]
MEYSKKKWLYLIVLSIVWGSSFILIKKALIGLSPFQLGALRTLFAAFFLLLIGFRTIKTIRRELWKWVFLSALLGTFIPAFLFAFAETEIDSAIASVLNSTTPLLTLLLGILVFSFRFHSNQVIGVFVGLLGSMMLIWEGAAVNPHQNYWYAGLVLIASCCYAINVNIIKKHLSQISPLAIASGSFVLLIIPSCLVLLFSDFFTVSVIEDTRVYTSIGYLLVLSVVGTGVAKVLFNKLVQISSPVFASSVTYMIPVVASIWGIADGESFTSLQVMAAGIIILGVYLANRKRI